MDPRELIRVAQACTPLRLAVTVVAAKKLQVLLHRLQLAIPHHSQKDSPPIPTLLRWDRVASSNIVWIQANAAALTLLKPKAPLQPGKKGQQRVSLCFDLSGHGHAVRPSVGSTPPTFSADSLNGHSTLDFDGSAILKAAPFASPLQQPVTIMIVARARGDTTLFDSLGAR